jgi:hypothetical protein
VRFVGIGGSETVTEVGDHPSFGRVYLRPKRTKESARVNLVSLGVLQTVSGFKIKYRQDLGAFIVRGLDGVTYEFALSGKLFVCDLSDSITDESAMWSHACYHVEAAVGEVPEPIPSEVLVSTVAANEELYTKKQVEAAKRVKVFSAAMGHLSQNMLHEIVNTGRVKEVVFDHDDINRAEKIYGPDLQAIRGKSTKRQNKKAEPVRGKVVDTDTVMDTDIMFVGGMPFLIAVFKPIMLTLATLIKSRNTLEVKRAIDKQIATVQEEGFKVIEVTADGEGAIGAMADDLKKAGCVVSIHGKTTHSADIDNKIRQVKNGVRSILVLPYLILAALIPFAVYFAVSKINMLPSRVNAHNYSPSEVFKGRSISFKRDLGGLNGDIMPFGSRTEIYQKTDNTVADRTSPALFLGSKGNAYGSAWFYKLDTKAIVSSDQWKHLPMDIGTINRVNEIARAGPLLPNKLPMFYKGVEIEDYLETDVPASDTVLLRKSVRFADKITVGGERDSPDMAFRDEALRFNENIEILAADDVREHHDTGVEPEPTSADEQGVEFGGVDDDVPASGADEPNVSLEIGGVSPKHHYPVNEEHSRHNPVEAPWHLFGRPLMPGEGREMRPRKPPQRYGFDALLAEADMVEDVFAVVQSAFKLPDSPVKGRRNYRPTRGGSRVQHARAEASRDKHMSAYLMSVAEALDKFGTDAEESLSKELTSLHEKGVFKQVHLRDLSPRQVKRIIRSKMFLKQKFKPDGMFEKLKSRYVAGGHMQKRSDYTDQETSSPTVSLQGVYMVTSVSAKEGRKVGSMDVGTAYLNAMMEKEVIMKIEKALAKLLVKMFPGKYTLDSDGCIYVELQRALYGCLESAKLWYDEICGTLTGMGFVANPKDPCVFNLNRNGHQVTLCLYVDDLLCTSIDESDIDWVCDELKAKYGTVTLTKGPVHSYLGQTFDFSIPGQVQVSMEGYVRDLLDLYEVSGYRVTPATPELYDIDESLPLRSTEEQDEFHSRVMKLMFLAQRARPDILTPVAFLSRRWSKVTDEDMNKLDRVLMYLNSFPDLSMTLCAEGDIRLYAYVDASFAVHNDMKSHTGCVISMGRGAVHVSSKRQQLVTKSSTESELVAVSDVLPQILWSRQFLEEQGYVPGKVTLYQDNQSTMAMIAKGRSTSSRTRHVAIRYFFVKDKVDSGEVEIVYLPTGVMRADIMTKPLQGELFRKMRDDLMGVSKRDVAEGATHEPLSEPVAPRGAQEV